MLYIESMNDRTLGAMRALGQLTVPSRLIVALVGVGALTSAACSSSSSPTSTIETDAGHDAREPTSEAGKEAGHDAPEPTEDAHGTPIEFDGASCSVEEILPPIVHVTNSATGAQICDPVITIVPDGGAASGDAGAGQGTSCAVTDGGLHFAACPTSPPDGGTLACVFLLLSVEGTVTLDISAPGYASKTVPNVSSGLATCSSAPTPATQVNIALTPLPDAG